MKTTVKRAIRDQEGNVLILVLVVLVVGGLILTPLLGLMGTGLVAGQVYEKKTAELYAADAGVEDAIWKIQHPGETGLPYTCGDPPWSYDYETSDVNDKQVHVYIDYLGEGNHRITSVATSDDGSSTTIDAHLSVSYMDLSALLEHAIVSNGAVEIDVELGGKTVVNGTIWLPDDDPENLKIGPNVQYDPDKVLDSDDTTVTWPTYEQLSGYYWQNVEGKPYPEDSIDIELKKTIGPCYTQGSLVIDNTGDPDTLLLGGTVYVGGDLLLAQAGSHNYTINLNRNTIFVEGTITAASAIRLSGSGCVIAKGDINCQPGIASQEGEFVLLMSMEGDAWVHPLGGFTGCIAANEKVDLQPNSYIEWISPEGKGLDFPMGVGDDDKLPPVTGLSIYSWEIK